MSNLFPNQTKGGETSDALIHLSATLQIPDGFTDEIAIQSETLKVLQSLLSNKTQNLDQKVLHIESFILDDALPIFEKNHQKNVFRLLEMN